MGTANAGSTEQRLPTEHRFRVADFPFAVTFASGGRNGLWLLPSFLPFREEAQEDTPVFRIAVDDATRPVPKAERERIRTCDTGNGEIIVDQTPGDGYQFIIKDINGRECCLLLANADFSQCRVALNGDLNMRTFGLNNAMMMVFAYATCQQDTVLIHASLVRQHGYGFAFTAKSGTGKSTQVSNWLKNLPDCDLMNDDNPIIRVIDGRSFIYGSPWSGKTPCYRKVKAPLGAISKIDRAEANSIERQEPIEAFTTLLLSCSSMKWDERVFHASCDTIAKIVECTPVNTLHCLPDADSARVCNAFVWQGLAPL